MAKKLSKAELVFEIHKASPFTSEKKLMQMSEDSLRVLHKWTMKPSAAKIIKSDDAIYDSKGNKVDFDAEEKEEDVVEPYNPDYLTDEKPEFDIASSEKRFVHKVSILFNKMRKHRIVGYWEPREEAFRIEKYVNGSEYPTIRYMWVDMSDNTYCFGTRSEALVYDGKVSVAVEAAAKWLNSKLVKK